VKGIRTIERHHLFPKAYLTQQGVEQRQRNSIANYAYVEWPKNMQIGARAPAEYWPDVSAQIKDQDRLNRQMDWHALPADWHNMAYEDFLQERRKLIARKVAKAFEKLSESETAKPTKVQSDLDVLLPEGQQMEFKSTFRVNLHTGAVDKRMEHAIAKTVAGFMNSQGGRLLIGMADNGEVLGLEADMKTMGKNGNLDGFELSLRKRIQDQLSNPVTGLVRIEFIKKGNLHVCAVDVLSGSRPVFCSTSGDSQSHHEFYVRDGNATIQLFGADQHAYAERHWQ
jgi:hypothetical protein